MQLTDESPQKGVSLEKKHSPHPTIETLLNDISTRFVSVLSDHVDEEILTAQRKICECLEIDACALWQFSPYHPTNLLMTHVYLPPQFPLEVQSILDARESFPWCLEMMMKKQSITLRRTTDAPTAAAVDMKNWNSFGVKSQLTFPLFVGDAPSFGALGFSMFEERNWDEGIVVRLQIVSQIFAYALHRKVIEGSLRESERRLKLSADAANAGLWSWDYISGKIWVTDRTRFLFGFSLEEEITADAFFRKLHPDDLERVRLVTEQAFREGSVVQNEYRIVLPDGATRWIAVRAQGLLKPSGEPDCMMGVALDVTRQKQVEEEVALLHNELAHLSRLLTLNEISTSLAHEINQPLAAIMNNAQAAKILLSRARDTRGEFPEIVDDIIQDAKRAAEVVHTLRRLVKKGEGQFEALTINVLINDVLALLHSGLAVKNVKLRLDLKSDLPDISGDRVRLQQVLLNLLTNALDAMNEAPLRILMVRSAVDGPDMVTVSVSDSGPGIAEAQLALVFQPFFTTKKDGLGLGLSICRSIIEEHGGRIWAGDNPAGGATFSFSLKALKQEPT